VTVDKWQPQSEGLCHANQSVVNCAVTMWMQPTHDFTDNSGTFDMATIWTKAHGIHLEQNSPLHGLKSISSIGKSARIDNGVGILKK
jgi:hypothetical protein